MIKYIIESIKLTEIQSWNSDQVSTKSFTLCEIIITKYLALDNMIEATFILNYIRLSKVNKQSWLIDIVDRYAAYPINYSG